jgi:hypothetical protein
MPLLLHLLFSLHPYAPLTSGNAPKWIRAGE